jgi:CRP-like cAMP-binding protein
MYHLIHFEVRMSQSDRLSAAKLLAKTKPFEGAEEALILEGPVQKGVVEVFERGGEIRPFAQAQPAMGLILSGKALVSKGKAQISTLTKGDLFGAVNLFGSLPAAPTSVTALAKTKIFYIPRKIMQDFMRENPAVAEGYIAYLSQRVYFLTAKIAALTAGSSEARLASALMEAAYKEKGLEASIEVENISRLARDLDLGRASLYRAIDSLQNKGIISREDNKLVIKDFDSLASLIEK